MKLQYLHLIYGLIQLIDSPNWRDDIRKKFKMKLIVYLTLFLTSISFNLHPSIEGKWIDKDDAKSVLIITSNRYIDVYCRDTIYSGKYSRSNYSCDSVYWKDDNVKKLDFIKVSDGRCFEIIGLTMNSLSLRYTTSGRLLVFRKWSAF